VAAQVINGKEIAARIRAGLKTDVARLAGAGTAVRLHVLHVGDDAASTVYVRNKARAAAEAGIACEVERLPERTSESAVLARVAALNADPEVSGLIVQLPLPPHIDENHCRNAVAPPKDVDGFHAVNLGHLLLGEAAFAPCTPLGVMRLLQEAGIAVEGRTATVVGRGNVGLPLAVMLTQAGATVTVCHSRTRDLAGACRGAEILVAAVGRPGTVTADMVRPGACVIDVGISRLSEGPLVGDVDFDKVRDVAGWITPVPGGVGPMTVAMLLANTVRAARRGAPAAA